jgi:hypothetical protein
VPDAFLTDAAKGRVEIHVETFPAQGFSGTFLQAAQRRSTPDVLVFDNYGILEGITTKLGRFEGIATDPLYSKGFGTGYRRLR